LPPTTCIPVALDARWWLIVLSVSVSTPDAVPKHWKLMPLYPAPALSTSVVPVTTASTRLGALPCTWTLMPPKALPLISVRSTTSRAVPAVKMVALSPV
jgi:hypothetical protein